MSFFIILRYNKIWKDSDNMERYEVLKNTLSEQLKALYEEQRVLKVRFDEHRKVKSLIGIFREHNINNADYSKVEKLRRFFPSSNKEFDLLKKFVSYKELIEFNKTKNINLLDLEQDIRHICSMYDIPPHGVLDEIIAAIHSFGDNSPDIMNVGKNPFVFEQTSPFSIKKSVFPLDKRMLASVEQNSRNSLITYINTICYMLANKIINFIEKVNEREFLNLDFENKDKEYAERIALIEKYSSKFNKSSLLSVFSSKEELDEFLALIKTLFDDSTCLEILKNIREDQEKLETVVEEISFSNLELSKFTDEERKIIEELREIYEDEQIRDTKAPFGENISYESRFEDYQKATIKDLLLDVRTLLQHIYDNKDVIKIFKLIVDLYNKNTLRIVRETIISDLYRIIDDFNNIISFIRNTYKDQNSAYEEIRVLESYINSIKNEYLPIALDLKKEDLDFDENIDNELDNIVTKFKSEIKKWKKEMTAYYHESDSIEEEREDTDNLVFCLEDDIDLSDEGHQREFIGAIEALEMKSSRDLKKGSGRNGMTRLRKTTENGDEKDFVDYVNYNILRGRGSIHFVPYRYSNNPYYRTGLIKFEPSQVVKDFLEKKYGLSKQSAYYGVFQVIRSMGADHSEYKFFEEYLLGNYQRIEEIALLFASDNPDFDKLVEVIDSMLKIKKDKLLNLLGQKH